MGRLIATAGPVSLCTLVRCMLLKTRALSIALGVERSRFHQVVAVCIGFLLLGVRSNGEDCRAHPSSPVRLPGEVIGSEPSLPVSTRMIYVFVLHV